jgi:integrase
VPAGDRNAPGPAGIKWFADLPGFGLRRYLSGRQAYVVQTRMSGRQRMVTLGSISLLSESEARRLARQILVRAQTGGNPAEDRTAALASPEFATFLEEYWLRSERRWKPTTQRTQGVYRRRYLDGAFEGQYVDQISQADILNWFNRTTEAAGPGGANRVHAILNAMFVRAEAWGYRPEGSNPCTGIRLNRRRKMERFLSVQELRRLGEALEAERSDYPIHTAAVMLILFTSCRSSEILGLRWLDVRGQKLQLRDSKTGPRTVWMGEEGRAVLDSLPRRRGIDWVFYNPVTRGPIGRLAYYWARIRERTGFSTLRLHDLRHTYASHAAALSETLPMIGKLLGHSGVRSTAIYTHLDDADVLRAAVELDDAVCHLIA